MGKIRVKTLGDEELEKEQKNEAKKRKEAKKTAKAPGMKGVNEQSEGTRLPDELGKERIVAVGPSEEELETLEVKEKEEAKAEEQIAPTPSVGQKKQKQEKPKKAFHSTAYQSLSDLVDKNKTFSLSEGLELLEKLQRKKFDETVELHVNTLATGISGNVLLPNGTGKKTRVTVANDGLIAEIEKGIINFDILVAQPTMMPKLARVAKILGPRGLMPNPKNGTITDKPEEVAKKYEGGQVNFKTEAKAPIIHLTVGKMSFGKEKLSQNIEALIDAIKKTNIRNVTLKSTMSPGIKIRV